MVSYYIISYKTILYNFAWYENVLFSSVLIDIELYKSEWNFRYNMVQKCNIWYYTILCEATHW